MDKPWIKKKLIASVLKETRPLLFHKKKCKTVEKLFILLPIVALRQTESNGFSFKFQCHLRFIFFIDCNIILNQFITSNLVYCGGNNLINFNRSYLVSQCFVGEIPIRIIWIIAFRVVLKQPFILFPVKRIILKPEISRYLFISSQTNAKCIKNKKKNDFDSG